LGVPPLGNPVEPLSLSQIWQAAQDLLRRMLNPDVYHLWFAPVRAKAIEDDCVILEVANDFCEVWLKDNYEQLIQEVLAHASGQQLRVRFSIASGLVHPPRIPSPLEAAPASSASAEINREQSATTSANSRDHIFNPKNTFDNFVVGSNNNFAHAAALAVAQAPGKSYNPLFVYGGVGLGKTHLLHAIGQFVVNHKKSARVAYLSSEKFTNEYIDAIQNNQLVRFRRKYRQTDVLLIDDIQFLSGKERIQEEFFHTFNALHEAHKQIVLTCDRPASEIQNLEQRLVSRFEWGLVTDLQPPDVETRVAILRKKEASLGVQLADAVIYFLAQRIRTNIRRLEGALIRVASYSWLMKQELNVESVETLLHDVLHEEGRTTVTVDLIQKRVAEHFDIRMADMTSKRRPENIAFPRQVAMFLTRHLTESSLSSIGEAFGGRDHGTVLHACRSVKDRMETDHGIRQVVNYLEKQLRP
jgi:chromosomal replication initiator protein